MAKYQVHCGCGHDTEIALGGPIKERQRRIEWMESPGGMCNKCYREFKINQEKIRNETFKEQDRTEYERSKIKFKGNLSDAELRKKIDRARETLPEKARVYGNDPLYKRAVKLLDEIEAELNSKQNEVKKYFVERLESKTQATGRSKTRNPDLDRRRRAKNVAPAVAKTPEDERLQEKWFARPNTMDMEGVDTPDVNAPPVKARRIKSNMFKSRGFR